MKNWKLTAICIQICLIIFSFFCFANLLMPVYSKNSNLAQEEVWLWAWSILGLIQIADSIINYFSGRYKPVLGNRKWHFIYLAIHISVLLIATIGYWLKFDKTVGLGLIAMFSLLFTSPIVAFIVLFNMVKEYRILKYIEQNSYGIE